MARAGMPAPAGGFVKLPRSVLLGPIGKDPAALALFVHLLAAANIEPKEWEGIRIERGQCVVSIRGLAETTGESTRNVRTGLKFLERFGKVTQQTTHRMTVVTICNYDDYAGYFVNADTANDTAAKRATQQVTQQTTQPDVVANYLPASACKRGIFEPTQQTTHKATLTKELYKNNREIIEKELQEKDPELAQIVAEFLDYKQEIGKPYKSLRSVRAVVDQLRGLSGGDAAKARAIVKRTIANGWQGLFRLDDDRARKPSTAADRLKIDNSDKFKTTI